MKVYYDTDANVAALRERRIAVIGYGSQGYAQSNNLKDSKKTAARARRPRRRGLKSCPSRGPRPRPTS